ncbi:hypothetical protein N8540_00685 [Gammaproteobacteria bacterium]|nr:hypothetical protein [Gammaproteobacteria bacterium]MDB4164704.1 hypothetical protein [Gammaproteobacteria bacterium]MDC1422087.1 hypothetical protein [Gammaproteobacteria bacterium]MDC1426925.1 hypothetical protein [Gammaproteobacteria bacterium]
MNITSAVSLGGLTNLLGTIGVIGSLIFVGLELQQSQRIALAGQQQARTELNSSRLLAELELMGSMGEEAITSGIEWDEMSPKQKVIREQIQRWFWTLNENNFIQNEMGLLNEDLWAQVERYIYARYSECHLRSIYKGMVSYRPLIDYINDLPDRCAQ